MDNDMSNGLEIVILDDGVFEIYRDDPTMLPPQSLVSVAVAVSDNTELPYQFLLKDIDDDPYVELISAGTTIEVFEFNGTHFFRQYNYSRVNPYYVNCRDDGYCMAVWSSCVSNDCTQQCYIKGFVFNESNHTGGYEINLVTPAVGVMPCLGTKSVLMVADTDYQGGGEDEFILGMAFGTSGADTVAFWSFEINTSSMGVSGFDPICAVTDLWNDWDCSDNCNHLKNNFNNPAIGEIDGTVNGKELVFGYQIAEDSYKLAWCKSKLIGGGVGEKYPKIANGEGEVVSNTFMGNFFSDSLRDNQDFGVMAFDKVRQQIEFIVVSKSNGNIINWYELESDLNNSISWNMTEYTNHYTPTVFASQQNSILYSRFLYSKDLDEFVTPYGVFSVDTQLWDNKAKWEWGNPYGESVLIPIDLRLNDGVMRENMLIYSYNALRYLYDGQVNLMPWFNGTESYIDPCIHAGYVALNTTMLVYAHVNDYEGQKVQFRATLYAGDTNKQYCYPGNNWSANQTSGVLGTGFSCEFQINKSTEAGRLIMAIRDASHSDINVTQELEFRVSTSETVGHVRGDGCISRFGVTVQPVPGEGEGDGGGEDSQCTTDGECLDGLYCKDGICTELPPDEDNVITQNVKAISGELNVPVSVLIILVMIGGLYFVLKEKSLNGSQKVILSLTLVFLLVLLGVVLKLLSVVYLILFIILGLTITAVTVGKKFIEKG